MSDKACCEHLRERHVFATGHEYSHCEDCCQDGADKVPRGTECTHPYRAADPPGEPLGPDSFGGTDYPEVTRDPYHPGIMFTIPPESSEPERCACRTADPRHEPVEGVVNHGTAFCTQVNPGEPHVRFYPNGSWISDATPPPALSPAEVADALMGGFIGHTDTFLADVLRAAVAHRRQMANHHCPSPSPLGNPTREGAIAKIEWLGEMHRLNTQAYDRVVIERELLRAERDALIGHRDEVIDQRDALATKVADDEQAISLYAALLDKRGAHIADLTAKLETSEEARRLADEANRELAADLIERGISLRKRAEEIVELRKRLAEAEARRQELHAHLLRLLVFNKLDIDGVYEMIKEALRLAEVQL